jgi:hypothetical protein
MRPITFVLLLGEVFDCFLKLLTLVFQVLP